MGRCYPHLNLEERRKLVKWLEAKIPIKEIADNLCRRPRRSTARSKRNPVVEVLSVNVSNSVIGAIAEVHFLNHFNIFLSAQWVAESSLANSSRMSKWFRQATWCSEISVKCRHHCKKSTSL